MAIAFVFSLADAKELESTVTLVFLVADGDSLANVVQNASHQSYHVLQSATAVEVHLLEHAFDTGYMIVFSLGQTSEWDVYREAYMLTAGPESKF